MRARSGRDGGHSTVEGPRKELYRRLAVASAGVLLVIAEVGAHRLSRTAEFTATFGSDARRAALCRAASRLSPARARRILSRLLGDPVEGVQLAAVTAVGGCPEPCDLDDRLEAMLLDPAAAVSVRTRAGQVLLVRKQVRPSVLRHLTERAGDRRFRAEHAILIASLCERRLPAMDARERLRLVEWSLDESDPAREHLERVVLDRVGEFSALRESFAAALDGRPSYEIRRYALAALSAFDGIMRGQLGEDWRERTVGKLGPWRPHVYEAEWAHDIRPNYHIGRTDGVTCLALGEGAGGCMEWRKGMDGCVDVGTARLNLLAPKDGTYSLWARVYFGDKCGNSFTMTVDGMGFRNESDAYNVMREWHWLKLLLDGEWPTVHLTAGLHPSRLEAREDDAYIDKLVLLPAGLTPEGISRTPVMLWDASLNSSISFDLEKQSLCRGETRFVTVWVRRNRPALRGGTVELAVPKPFEIERPPRHEVRFAEGNPLCRTSFRVRLPDRATAGEGVMEAVYTDLTGEKIVGRFILGAELDWLCTGPLGDRGGLQERLSGRTTVTDAELGPPWRPFPREGYDRYRRLDFERAYGQLRDVYLYLVADVLVDKDGEYLALLTADDTAYVYIDGRPVVAQEEGGPGEGRMVSSRVRLARGRHRILVRHYQADLDEPRGPGRYRESPNHCVMKLLLRERRHRPAAAIKGPPMRGR